MNKRITFFILVNLTFLLAFSSCFSATTRPINLFTTATSSNAYIYVNSTLAGSIQTEILQYKADLETDGYNVTVYNWTDLTPDPLIRVYNLKANLTNEYTNNNLVGAVLIGDMPYANFEPCNYYGSFPCDLFLMDLDGYWADTGGIPSVFDTHNNNTGDVYPEIFIARINPYLQNTTNPIAALKDYFSRNHLYRNGTLTRPDNCLMYIDDDWSMDSAEWQQSQTLYTNVTVFDVNATTTATHYLNEIQKSYEFIHAFIHSDYDMHYFKPLGPANEINCSQIQGLNLKAYFYILFCCLSARCDMSGVLAYQYLFSNSSLGIFSCTTAGGFWMPSYLYDPLKEGKSLGESFRLWWFNDLYNPYGHGPTDIYSKGNVLLGDPFVRIKSPSGGPTTSPAPIPGFEIIFILTGLIAVLACVHGIKRKNNFNSH